MRGFKRLFIAALVGLTGLSTVQAEVNLTGVTEANIPVAVSKSNVYIIQMRDDPVVAYAGGIARYNATKPGKGKKINPNSAHVKKYVNYLDSTHNKALRAVGVKEKIYSYRYALNGFAAVLTSAQFKALQARSDVVQIWRDELRQPATNSTPDYLGLTGPGGVWDLEGKGEDIIIGVLDTGIWPEHPSFSDQTDFSYETGIRSTSRGRQNRNLAYGPPPADWHGSCQIGEMWSATQCNNKVIGAYFYPDGYSAHGHSGILMSDFLSPRDSDGHGSHTASTAAGNEGPINTINDEEVSGIAPRARLAIYKVCWADRNGDEGCASSDSAAAIDQAVADGVDVINFSIGGPSTIFAHPDDIAFLFAADAGVFVATSNGNAGPGAETTGTPAGIPWITAVGASQDDEAIQDISDLEVEGDLTDNYLAIEGDSDVPFSSDVTGAMVPAEPLEGCDPLTNDGDISGNIALIRRGTCAFTDKYNNAAAAGAVAIIVYNDGTTPGRIAPFEMYAPGTTIPGAMISFPDGDLIETTVSGGGSVTGTIGPGVPTSQENRIAGFSSRGPNGGAPDVIKPDVAAPGVGIIAAETMRPNALADGGVPYQSISGTSMASPHVAGVFALLKEAHPDWSPAMAKSALMTSARQNLKKTFGEDDADPFDIGAGAIEPAGAFEPGLVYHAGILDYLAFTCETNINLADFFIYSGVCLDFPSYGYSTDGSDLNLASIGIGEFLINQTVTRWVTSVAPDGTTFDAVVQAPPGIDVVVTPNNLVLNKYETVQVEIEFTSNADLVVDEWTFGSLTWVNDAADASDARSPIAIRPIKIGVDAEVDGVVDNAGEGSVDISVEFGYDGDYSVAINGLAKADVESGSVNSSTDTQDFVCMAMTALDHLRFATFDEDTTTPGEDDLDLQLFTTSDCDTLADLAFVGSSGEATSNEVIDVPNAEAGNYVFVIDYYDSPTGTIDYKAFIYAVSGDESNTSISGVPPSAVAGASATVTVDYGPLELESRFLGVVSHQDGGGEIATTIVDVDTQQ